MRYVSSRLIVVFTVAAVALSAHVAPTNGAPKGMIWDTLAVGAGGFIGGIDIAGDGTKVIRTDTYGAYVCSAPCRPSGRLRWSQVVLMSTMPSGDPGVGLQSGAGVYEIRIGPSNRLYMYFNGYVYRSDNGGESWNATGFSKVPANGGDQVTETIGPYIAIDPNNSSIVYVGTPSKGLFVSTNAGVSFSSVSAVGIGNAKPTGASQGGSNIIAFDTSSVVVGNNCSIPGNCVTQGIYVSTYGVGIYHSTDGGATWTELNSSGMPTTHQHIYCAANGTLYLVDNSGGDPPGNIARYSDGSWSKISPTSLRGARALAINPENNKEIVAIDEYGHTSYSSDGGRKWTGPQSPRRVAFDIPWLANTNEVNMSPGNIVFDPSQSSVLYMAEGTGVWHSNLSSDRGLTWTSQSAGIEQLVSNWAVSPPGGNLILTFDDRPVFTITNPNVYPSKHGLNYNNPIIHGYSVDWASSAPGTIVVVAENGPNNQSGYSSNGGGTDGGPSNWSLFAGNSHITDLYANGGSYVGGGIAAASSTNFVWATGNNTAGPSRASGLWITKDGGATWTSPAISGVSGPNPGWGGEYYYDRQIVAADRFNIGTFYAYNEGSSTASAGIYRSTDGGSTWILVHRGAFDSGAQSQFNAQMRTVPGKAGNIFFTSGPQTCPCPNGQAFHMSIDGGLTWTSIAKVQEVWSFGFGKTKPGSDGYPAVFLYGWVKGIGGLWRADNIDTSPIWTQLSGLYPLNRFDQVKVVEGNNDIFGTVYVGFAGSGFVYGHLD